MFWKKTTITLAGLLFLISPLIVSADGLIVPIYDYDMYETHQQAVVFYENGVETLVLSIGFEGDSENFGWLVPVPNLPEISKSSDELFTSLSDITTEYYYTNDYYAAGKQSAGAGEEDVTIIKTQKIDYYEVATLQAGNADDLTDWLTDNDYNFPAAAGSFLESYISNNWYFVAMKISPEETDAIAEQDLKIGHATPVKLVFNTENIIYPMKLTGAMSYFNSEYVGEDYKIINSRPTFKTGKTGKGINIKSRDVFTIPLNSNFNSQKGSIALWVNGIDFLTEDTYHEFINIVSDNQEEIIELRSQGNKLEFSTTSASGQVSTWQTFVEPDISADWHQVAVTWKIDEKPMIYFDGQALVTSIADNLTRVLSTDALSADMINPTSSGQIYLGQRAKYLGDYSFGGLMDELAFFQEPLTLEQIVQSYNQGSYPLISSLLWSASFEENLNYTRLGGDTGAITYYRSNVSSKAVLPTSMYITLYTIANHRQTLPGFTTNYAGWLSKKEVEELAYDDQLQPWIDATQNKYFLTKLTKYMDISEMKNDLVFRRTDSDSAVNAPETATDSQLNFNLVMLTGSFISAALLIIFAYLLTKKSKPKITKNNQPKKNNK